MEIVSLFKDFGYPALVSGVLLWVLITKIEKIVVFSEQIKNIMDEYQKDLREHQKDLREHRVAITDAVQSNKEMLKEIKQFCEANKEQTRPRRSGG